MYLNNKYTTWYYQIIDNARSRKSLHDIYLEKHHIIPECFFINRRRQGPKGWIDGDPNSSDNIVELTAREHFICHLLLTKMTEGAAKGKMYIALFRICHGNTYQKMNRMHKINSLIYQEIRLRVAELAAIRAKTVHTGKKRSDLTKKRLSEANKGKTRTDEQKKRNREIQRSRTYKHSPETLQKIRQAGIGRPVSLETREKIRAANKGKPGHPRSEETRAKMSASQKARGQKGKPGKPRSDDVKKKISETMKGRPTSDATREKIRQSKIGTKMSEETRAQMSRDRRGKVRGPMSEETKRKIGEANRLRQLEKKLV